MARRRRRFGDLTICDSLYLRKFELGIILIYSTLGLEF